MHTIFYKIVLTGLITLQLFSITSQTLKSVTHLTFDAIGYFEDGVAVVRDNKLFGLIDTTGKIHISPRLSTYHYKPAPVKKDYTQISDDMLNQLEKLGKLKEQRILTDEEFQPDEEFQQQKKKLLG